MQRFPYFKFVALGALVPAMAVPALAEAKILPENRYAQETKPETQQAIQVSEESAFARFKPSANPIRHRIDYAHWDEALGWFVIPMGPSMRQTAGRVVPATGTRFVYGHQSRLRLEGNRVAFSFMNPRILNALTAYRKDLEQIGSTLEISKLPRNEQLAYWINLHNVAVIEAIALQYPMRQPSRKRFGTNGATLQDAKLVTINGIELSPRDIREKIVYPNWKDPRVIYAFWRGDIGGPTIQRNAFTGANVDFLLSLGAEDFVNSLRGVESWGGQLRVSKIYQEAEPFYFPDKEVLRAHLSKFARDDVKKIIAKRTRIGFNRYEDDIADMLYGQGDPGLTNVCVMGHGGDGIPTNGAEPVGLCNAEKVVTDRAAQRLMRERAIKLNRAIKRGIRTGTVTVAGYDPSAPPKEVQ